MSPMAIKILKNAVSKVGCTSTFDPTCYLVDYNLKVSNDNLKVSNDNLKVSNDNLKVSLCVPLLIS